MKNIITGRFNGKIHRVVGIGVSSALVLAGIIVFILYSYRICDTSNVIVQ